MEKNARIVSGIAFLNRIDEILEEQNRTRKSFCESLQILPGTMATWKTKDIMPPINTINLIAKKLEVSIDWLCNGNPDFEKTERVLGEQSRTNIRRRIYTALKKKYENDDLRFQDNFLNNNSLLEQLHEYYFSTDFVSYKTLYNWAKGRCEIELYVFTQLSVILNTTLGYILRNSEFIILSNPKFSLAFEPKLYNLAQEYRNELYCLANLTEGRKQSAHLLIKQLMELEYLKFTKN
ncbi:MAG: helix-turn-helix domain-containing protein [Spirochaetia bacterium]|nr:helix-turn-helix domain-containing protein [Spirochaetia bacterium]